MWYKNIYFPDDTIFQTLKKLFSFRYIKETFFSKPYFIEHNPMHHQQVHDPLLHKHLYLLLEEFHKIMLKYDVPYFLDSGSLLGCYRNGEIIKHDDDIDVCLFEEDFSKLRKINYVNPTYELQVNIYDTIYDYKNMVSAQFIDTTPGSRAKIDIFSLKKIDDTDRYFTSFIHIGKDSRAGAEARRMYYRKAEVFPLINKPFGPMQQLYPVPRDTELLLKRLYGTDLSPYKFVLLIGENKELEQALREKNIKYFIIDDVELVLENILETTCGQYDSIILHNTLLYEKIHDISKKYKIEVILYT